MGSSATLEGLGAPDGCVVRPEGDRIKGVRILHSHRVIPVVECALSIRLDSCRDGCVRSRGRNGRGRFG